MQLEFLPASGAGLEASVTTLLSVLMIDLVLAGDNAVAVGLAAGGLPPQSRKKVILYGLGVAVVLRVAFALMTGWLLGIIGLLFVGGLLLLWVCWKMWCELRERLVASDANASLLNSEVSALAPDVPVKSFGQALLQVLIADITMSLDNVLAVAGAAREHPAILCVGLLLSIGLMGLAANAIASLLSRFRWIGFVGLAIVLCVAVHMTWDGYRSVVIDLRKVDAYNAAAPSFLDITANEVAKRERAR